MTSDLPSNIVNTASLDDDSFKPVIPNCELFELVGRGGMALVYRGRQILLDRDVAVKVLLKRGDGNPVQQQQRFLREAQLSTILKHPNICRIVSFGVDDCNSVPFIIFEYLNGLTLNQCVDSQGPLAWEICLRVFDEICDGLAYAHSEGVIHRDLKPGNVMLVPKADSSEFTAKILDFGIAKLIGDEQTAGAMQQITQTGALLGSPDYMSPEQCTGGKTDERSDIYALGCMLYFACSGKPPFAGDSAYETMSSHVNNTVPDLRTTHGVPGQVDLVIKKAMHKDPELRYQDVASFREAIHYVNPHVLRKARATQKRTPKFSSGVMVVFAVLIAVLLLGLLVVQPFLAEQRADAAMEAQLAVMQTQIHQARFKDVLETLRSINIENLSDKRARKLVNLYLELVAIAQQMSHTDEIVNLSKKALDIALGNHLDPEIAQCQFLIAKYRSNYAGVLETEARKFSRDSSPYHLILAAKFYNLAIRQVKDVKPRRETEGSFDQTVRQLQLANSPENLLDVYSAYIAYEKTLHDRAKVAALLSDAQKLVSQINVDKTLTVATLLDLAEGYQFLGDRKQGLNMVRVANAMTLRLKSYPGLRARGLKALGLTEESYGNLPAAWDALRAIPDLKGLQDPALKCAALQDYASCLIRSGKFDEALVQLDRARVVNDKHLKRANVAPATKWQLYLLRTQILTETLAALFKSAKLADYEEADKRVSSDHLVMFKELKRSLESDDVDRNLCWPIYDAVAYNSACSLLTSAGPTEADAFMTSAIKYADDQLVNPKVKISLLGHQGLLRKTGRIGNGVINSFESAIALQRQLGMPEDQIALYALPLGCAYIEQGRVETGVELCERYLKYQQDLEVEKSLAPSLLGLGDAYARRGDYVAALNVYDKFFKLVPNSSAEYKRSEPLIKVCREAKLRAE